MDKFVWSPVYDVQNDQLNNEHRELISLMENLHFKNQSLMDKKSLLEEFEKIVKFTKIHFQDEEVYMEKIKYPKVTQHKVIHKQLLDSLNSYADEFKKSANGRFPLSVFDFFKNWLTTHIVLFDKDYAKYKVEHQQ